MESIIETLSHHDIRHALIWNDDRSGLLAFVVIDDVTLGPAAGGIRTQPYASLEDALGECAQLARSMTHKCALAGVAAGGGKIVVVERPGWDRRAAFAELGRRLHDLAGRLHTGSDIGTGLADLEAAAAETPYVHTELPSIARGVARGVLAATRAARAHVGLAEDLAGARVAVQGCGAVGEAVAAAFALVGAKVVVADLNAPRAAKVADAAGAEVVSPEEILDADVDVLSPCAGGRVLTSEAVARVRAPVVCGGANHILSDRDAGLALKQRDIVFVPDMISSAGGVAEGMGKEVMNLDDRGPLIDGLYQVVTEVLGRAQAEGKLPSDVALARAQEIVRAATRTNA